MSNKSKKLNREFDRKILVEAKKIAAKYEIIIIFEDGEYYGKGLELPHVFAEGKTPNACVKNVREAMTATIAHLLETGESIPIPANEGKRTEQVNIRLSIEEKTVLAATAKSHGYQGLSDYVRAKLLA